MPYTVDVNTFNYTCYCDGIYREFGAERQRNIWVRFHCIKCKICENGNKTQRVSNIQIVRNDWTKRNH